MGRGMEGSCPGSALKKESFSILRKHPRMLGVTGCYTEAATYTELRFARRRFVLHEVSLQMHDGLRQQQSDIIEEMIHTE